MDNWTVSDVTGHAGVIGQYLVFQINQSEDKFALLWGEAQLCLPYDC